MYGRGQDAKAESRNNTLRDFTVLDIFYWHTSLAKIMAVRFELIIIGHADSDVMT